MPTHPYMIWTFGKENHRKAIPAHECIIVFRKPDPNEKLKDWKEAGWTGKVKKLREGLTLLEFM